MRTHMEFDKFTERSQGFVQAAQSLALRTGHQRLMPEHLLKVLLDDKEGLAANLIRCLLYTSRCALTWQGSDDALSPHMDKIITPNHAVPRIRLEFAPPASSLPALNGGQIGCQPLEGIEV